MAEFTPDDPVVRGGKVWLWRSSLESEVWKRGAACWMVWCWCLMRANWKPGHASFAAGRGQSALRIERGQFITGRRSAAEEIGLAPNTVQNVLRRLQDMGNIRLKTTKNYTIVTVVKFDSYQNAGPNGDPAIGPPSGPPSGPALGTIEEGKKLRREEDNTELPFGSSRAPDSGESKKRSKPKAVTYPASFVEFWNAYPRRDGKQKALAAYIRAGGVLTARGMSREAARDFLLAKAKAYAASPKGREGAFVPYPQKWLNEGRYDDPPESWAVDRNGATPTRKGWAMPTNLKEPAHDPN